MKKTIYLMVALLVLTFSCKKDDDGDSSKITVNLSATASGTLSNSPKIVYKNASGTEVTETLTTTAWSKSFTVNSGYKLY